MNKKDQIMSDSQLLRLKAEEKLKRQESSDNRHTEMEPDVQRLLHELQVHQIELEMQNEELREANETAESALKKYTMLYDLAPMGYFTLESDGSICDLNFTGAELLKEKRYSLVNSNFKLFISKDSQKVFNDFFSKVYTSGAKESCNIRLGYDGNPLAFVYIEGVVTGDNRQCLLSVVDISGIKQQINL